MPVKDDISITRLPTAPELSRFAADLILDSALGHVRSDGRFTLALSGGSTPRPTHRLLAEEPHVSAMPWRDTFVFWVDERCVPPGHPVSNYGNAVEDFIQHVPLEARNVFPMPTVSPAAFGASRYEAQLREFFGLPPGAVPRFDLVVLGLGTDGHTASLFPGDPSLEDRERLVLAVHGGTPPVDRLTLTLPVLNNSGEAVFLVSGGEKAGVVRAALEDRDFTLPAARVVPGKIQWLLDCEAASGLSKPLF